MNINKTVSVVIPVYNEEKFIADCLQSVYDQDYPKELLEIIVVDGHSTDATRQVIETKFPEVIVLDNPHKIVPISMNLGIGQARGEYIVRLDAHAIYPDCYISRLVQEAIRLHADNVGAVCRTLPGAQTPMAEAIAIALSTKFGMGSSDFRVGAAEIKEVDTVPFGCFPREVFDRVGLYDEELVRNQDDELNGRITRSGGRIYLIPDLIIDYYGRKTLPQVCKMFYQYGLFKPLGNRKLGGATTIRQFVPLCFVLGIILGGVISLLFPLFVCLYALGIGLYLLLDLFVSWFNSKQSLLVFLRLCLVYPTIHFGYGWGYIVGIYKLLMKQPFSSVQVNR